MHQKEPWRQGLVALFVSRLGMSMNARFNMAVALQNEMHHKTRQQGEQPTNINPPPTAAGADKDRSTSMRILYKQRRRLSHNHAYWS